ncbi:uncharacterized protein LOC126839375 [Adelges cooleyi]|uniref:uncharacterized protein LOC126839375 n=1 Tax=Adelges cooleyi TaxID=133065 RepID=UPI00217F6F5C|nr:uncharacterized protein LOC126839375 [Adelges cooleyi]
MHRKGGKDWESVQLHSRQLFDRTVTNIRNYLRQRRILLEPYFKVFDKNNHGHIPRSTFRRALSTADIQCSDEELRLLEKRFMNVDGFNYLEFLVMIKDLQEEDIEPESKEKSSTDEDTKNTEQISSNLKKLTLASLISKIQIIVKRGRIKVDQFLRQFDTTNHRIIAADNFLRGIAMSGIRLESAELNLLCDEFSSKENPGYVDYRRFCNIIEEAFTTLGLEQNPSANPKEYLITYEGPSNYLTEEQKISVDSALSKLCSTPNNGLDDLFKDYDKYRQGIVTEEAFLGALTVSKLNMLISLFEIKSLIKGFSKEDYPQAFNYRAFMKAIEYKQKVLAESNSNQ